MRPGLTLNETVIALIVDGDSLRCDTARFSTEALLDAYLSFGSVIRRRLEDVREASPGNVAGRVLSAHEGR
jgi:hypothetical protein